MALISRWVFVIMMALFPIASHALALGKLKVHSALNEPLKAEIAFTTITDKELKGLNVSLASRADFDAAGVDRLPFLSTIKFTVEKKPDGQYYLQLRTEQPVDEPYLHLLMQVDWPGGRLVREYTALIDPPYLIAGKAAPVEAPKVTAPAPTPEVQPPAPSPAPEAPQAEMPKEEVPPVVAQPEQPKAEEAPPKQEEVAQQPAPAEAPPPEEQKLGPPDVAEGAAPEEPATPQVEPLEATPKEQAATAPAEQPASPVWATMSEYDVKKGDTLWRIAEKARADNKDVSLEQVMLAIYRTNKNAFFKNNVNNLKAGKILKMPERAEVEAVTRSQAHGEFRAQYDAWLEYKLKLASASSAIKVTEAPEAAPEEKATMPAEKPASPEAVAKPEKPEAKAPKAAAGTAQKGKQEELLKIVRSTLQKEKGTPDKNVADKESPAQEATREQQALADRAATLEESLESKRLENKDLSEKVGIVRSQLKKESRLIELENKSLVQQEAKAPETKPAEPAAKPAEAPKTPETVAAVKPEEKIKAEPLPPPAKPAPAHVAPKKRRPPPPPPKEEEKGFLATVLDALQSDLLMPAIIGVVVLLGGAVALVYFRRRQRSIAEFEESILSADAISTEQPATTGDAGAQQPAVTTGGDTSFLSDFSQGGMGNIHTDEVDPVAEAEVYLAYGRDETAEEILKEAMVKNPDRQELKLKLLEIYHQRNDVAAFETLAEELYAALGGRGGKIWDKVEEMGRKLNPENPMFRGGAPGAPTGAAPAAMPAATPAAHADTQPSPGAESKTEAVGDFDFDLPASAAGEEKPAAGGIDFGAAPEAPPAKASMESSLESLDVGTEDSAIDFDLGGKSEEASADLDLGRRPNEAVPAGNDVKWEPEPAAAPPAAGAGDANLDAAAPPAGEGSAQWDETATKLDLAKAYIDMGDAEGARSILQEVMSEGSDAQKQQAQELSTQIA